MVKFLSPYACVRINTVIIRAHLVLHFVVTNDFLSSKAVKNLSL